MDTSLTNEIVSILTKRAKVALQINLTMDAMERGSTYHGYKNSLATSFLDYFTIDKKYPNEISNLEYIKPIPWDPENSSSINCRNETTNFGIKRVCHPDYKAVLGLGGDLNTETGYDICYYIDTLGVKEVWVYSYHVGYNKTADGKYFLVNGNSQYVLGPVESDMSMGKISSSFWNNKGWGDVSNSDKLNDLPICNHTYTLYNYNYGGGGNLAEALEDHGHQIENVNRYIDTIGNGNGPSLLFDERFIGWPNGPRTFYRCGWTHYPPNVMEYTSGHDYDWGNTRSVLSDCEDWRPDGSGVKTTINCGIWGEAIYPGQIANYNPDTTLKDCLGGDENINTNSAFKIWWMQNIPGRDNGLIYNTKQLRNWWEAIGDFDEYVQGGVSLTEP